MPAYNPVTDEVSVEPVRAVENHPKDSKFQRKWWTINIPVIVIILLVGLAAITLAFGISIISKNPTSDTKSAAFASAPSAQDRVYPESCMDALKKGHTMSGIVMLQPSPTIDPFETYCDMNSVGGGWTLIASIHEDDINADCNHNDMWSSPSGYSSPSDLHYANWLNMKTFGDVNAATNEDFKCSAYYSVKASDVMIWHVPNNIRLSHINKEAFFKYYTDSHFLTNYGSNLQALYTQHAPLKMAYPKNMSHELNQCVVNTNWTYPNYPSYCGVCLSPPNPTPNNLVWTDEVFIQVNDDSMIALTKRTPNKLYEQVEIVTYQESLPFTTLAFIDNTDKSIEKFTMRILRNDSIVATNSRMGINSYGGFDFRFKYMCDKTVCRILFFVTSPQEWNSLAPAYNLDGLTSGVYNLTLTANIRQVLIGYLVIRQAFTSTYESALDSVFQTVMSCFGTKVKLELSHFPAITTPAKFLKGGMTGFTQGVTPGHIQFRQYDALGYPYALCPGIRVTNASKTEHHCVGRAQADFNTKHKCGDFAAWDNLAEHLVKRPSSISYRITNDLTSTLLIFVR